METLTEDQEELEHNSIAPELDKLHEQLILSKQWHGCLIYSEYDRKTEGRKDGAFPAWLISVQEPDGLTYIVNRFAGYGITAADALQSLKQKLQEKDFHHAGHIDETAIGVSEKLRERIKVANDPAAG